MGVFRQPDLRAERAMYDEALTERKWGKRNGGRSGRSSGVGERLRRVVKILRRALEAVHVSKYTCKALEQLEYVECCVENM